MLSKEKKSFIDSLPLEFRVSGPGGGGGGGGVGDHVGLVFNQLGTFQQLPDVVRIELELKQQKKKQLCKAQCLIFYWCRLCHARIFLV